MLVGLLIEVGKILAGSLLMTAEVVIGAVGNAPQLAPIGEREGVFYIGSCAGVERKLGRLMVTQTEVFLLDAQRQQPVFAEVFPVSKPLKVGARLAEELALHLLKLTGAEDEVARGDLVTECLADLANAERQLFAGGALDVCEVYENALSGLGTQVAGGAGVLGNADGSLEHEVELADGCEVVLAADGADDILVGSNKCVHLVKGHCVDIDLVVLLGDKLVGSVAGFAGLAVEQRVREAGHVAGGDPGLGVHDDGGVKTDIVGAFLNELLQPGFLDIVLELHAERAVVPAVCKSAVDLAACVNIAAVLAQGDDLVH